MDLYCRWIYVCPTPVQANSQTTRVFVLSEEGRCLRLVVASQDDGPSRARCLTVHFVCLKVSIEVVLTCIVHSLLGYGMTLHVFVS